MSVLSANIFLDALILIIDTRDEETLTLVDRLVDVYTEELKTNRSMDGILIRRFIDLLNNIKKLPRGDEGNTSRIVAITNFITNCKDMEHEDRGFYDALQYLFTSAKEIRENTEELNKRKRKIKNTLTFAKFKRCMAKMYANFNEFASSNSDPETQDICLTNIINQANIIVESAKCDFSMLSSSAEERVVFSDKTSVKEALTRAITAESSEHVLKTDLQGLNMMLGHRGGFVRGEFAVIYGLSHHFKTGLLLTIARGIASQNKAASVAKPGKKPMILFITLENFANRNAYWFYKAAYACIFNQAPPKDMNIDEMVKIINDFYTRNGWEFILEKYKGINFGYDEYVKTIEKYEALGYDVVVSLVDYMEKMKKKSSIYDNNSDSHEALAALAQGLFDYNKSKEITFITPHQFNRQMQKVADQVKVNVIKHFSTDGVSGSIAINQIVDLELYVYIETDLDKQAWLTVMRGKHRYVDDTPIAHRYFAYPFVDKIGIVEDVSAGKKKMFVRDIYSNMSSSDDKKKKDNDVAMDLDTF